MTLWSDRPVPQAWRGLWRRLSLEGTDGAGDVTTTVLWLQTDRVYADIRVPADRPDFARVGGFADLTPDQAAFLARQEGFAGRLLWRGDCCHWERTIDFAPSDGPPDEGRLRRDRRMLVEDGLHAAYVEHWWQEIHPPPTPEAPVVEPARGHLGI